MKKIFILFIIMFCVTLSAFAQEIAKWDNLSLTVYFNDDIKKNTMMKQAFKDWEQKSSNLVSFSYTDSPDNANIIVKYVERCENAPNAIGKTIYNKKNNNTFVSPVIIEIALKKPNIHSKTPLNSNVIYHVMLHEVGHAIGLSHSDNKSDIMYPSIRSTLINISPNDIKRLNEIYK